MTTTKQHQTVRAADLQTGDVLARLETGHRWDRRTQDRIPAITRVETVTIDSRGESWADFQITFITFANGHQTQLPPDSEVRILPRERTTPMTTTKMTRELQPGDRIKHGRMSLTITAVDRCPDDIDWWVLETRCHTCRPRELLVYHSKEWQLA